MPHLSTDNNVDNGSIMSQQIRVGFIGLSGNKGWAVKSHYLAIKQLQKDYRITALLNSTLESSRKTIGDLQLDPGTCKPFGNDIIKFAQYDQIDLIVVSVKVPEHYKICMDLLENKPNGGKGFKILYVEWSLGNGLNEAQKIYDKASEVGVQGIICLQGRYSPYILRAKELINNGGIGEINCIEISANGGWYGYERPIKSPSYLYDLKSGTNLITIAFAHTIDLIQYITGSYFNNISSMIFNNISEQELVDEHGKPTGQFVKKTVPDHLLFQGSLIEGNVPVSCSFKGGTPQKKFTKNLVIDIHGTKGDLKIEGDAGFPEISNLVLYFCGIRHTLSPDSANNSTDKDNASLSSSYNNNTYFKIKNQNTFNGEDVEKADTASQYPCKKRRIVSFQRDNSSTNNNVDQTVEVYHLRNYNPVVGNIMRVYEAITKYYRNEGIHRSGDQENDSIKLFDAQKMNNHGFPTFKDALILHRLIENVFESSKDHKTVNVSHIDE
ncbi:transcription regulator GAL80 SCDLUD_000434 [Saccharomycodes ludwigii]|uniref:transcription regulator GAL80 n=1 Tax=Saccharomycodes ludwigii TaxID=36035 RepID=UPI001E887498|nr:hypothetical protein SCDLUD_000434 [Saccharomycodes ludwigii]KAH3902842.1 hypothetical protein SCDLUD_000434 [Saccharomycodes ludwigii]